MSKPIFIFFFIACSILHLHAQELPDDIRFTTYTRANGLPEEAVNSTIRDSRGFLWLGSKEGLFRFDGKHFKSWYANSADSTMFHRNNNIVFGENNKKFILFNSGGNYWQINIYTHKIERLPAFKSKSPGYNPVKLNPNNWFASDADSMYITDADLNILKSYSSQKYFTAKTYVICFPLKYPYSLIYGNSMKYYAFNYVTDEVLPINFEIKLNINGPVMHPKFYDSTKNRVYFNAYFDGYFYVDLNIPAQQNYKPIQTSAVGDPSTRSAELVNDTLLLQGGDNGLYISNFTKAVLYNHNKGSDKLMTEPPVLNIYKDNEENIWVSTNNGLNRFSLKPSTINYLVNEKEFSKGEAIKQILKAKDGNIYFLALNKSLYRLNKSNHSITRLDSSIGYTWSAVSNANTIIATGGGKKIIVYDIATGKTKNPSYLSAFYGTADLVTLVYKATNGDLWYSINAGGGLVYNPNGTTIYKHFSNSSNPPDFSHRQLQCAAEDSKGNLWFGYQRSHKLLKWVAALQKFEEYAVDELIPDFKTGTGVNNSFIDAKDNLWIILDGAALLRYNINTKTGKYYDMNDGLPTESITGVCADAKDRLWVSSLKGLSCYLPDRDKFTTFTVYDGLPEDKFTGEGIFFDKDENLLYVGAQKSIAWFNPDTLLQKSIKTQPPVYIDEIMVNGKKYFFDDETNIRLKSNENNVEFTIAAVDFFRNDQLIFQYNLTGSSNDWVDLGTSRSVTFNNLKQGKYNFLVRCKYNGNDVWQETQYPFTFTIATPWNKSWWFILLTIAAGAFITWFIIRTYYVSKLAKQKAELEKQNAVESERTRIATDMHDDFGASLSRIKFLSEKIKLQPQEKDLLNYDLSKISNYSDEMAEKMNEIVWALNKKYDSLGDLIAFCRSYAADYLATHEIQLHFSGSELADRTIPGEIRRNIFLIVKESMHNVVKHAQASIVTITFAFNENLAVCITDNGKGIDTTSIRPFANGLENMKKRVASVGGSITIENKNGTVINLKVPLHN